MSTLAMREANLGAKDLLEIPLSIFDLIGRMFILGSRHSQSCDLFPQKIGLPPGPS